MMAKVERRKPKGQNSSRYEAAGSAPLSSTSYAVGYSMHAVMMQCLLFAIFLLLLTPNLSSAALPTIEVLPPITDHLKKPDGVAVGADEKIYIADSNNNLVHVFNRSGQYQGVISNLNAPTAVAVDAEGRIYVGNAEFGIDNVEVYASDLSLLGKLGSGNREFLTPVGIAIDSAGLIYVVDGRKNVVKVYKADRSFEFSFGSPGAADGEFQAPSSIVINEARSEILIPDLSLAGNSARVQVFDLNGVFLRSFRTEDANGVGFSNPTGIAVDTLDRIYVTDSSQANVVMVYDALGTPIDTLYDSNVSLPSPQDVAFAPGTSRLFIASLNPANVHEGAVETFGIDSSYGSIAVSPESHDFGSTAVSAASASQSFNISNTGNGKLYVEGAGGITLTGANASEFSIVSNDCADTILVPAAGCTIGVQFEPVSAGSKSASLAIVSDDLYMPTLSVALSGNAVAQQYKLTVSKGGDGNGTVLAAGINCGTTCSADYVAGTVVTLSVTHGGDAVFAGWSGGGCNGTADCEVTMGASHNVTAIFNNNPVPVPTHSITASASANGSISPAGTVSVDEGSTATFDITAADGYRVSDVLVDSVSVGAVGSYSFKDVDAAHTISAEFTAVSTLLLSSIEIGEVSVGDEWKPVTLSNTFTDPIVVLKPASLNDTSSAVIQMRSVSAQSFEVRIREWDYVVAMEGDGGQHEEEQVSYVVMERGSYTLDDGTRVEAGRFDTDVLSASFTQTFVTAPVVISSIVTNNDAEDTPAIIQMSNVGITGFDYKLQEEELNDQVHAVETVSFIAWEASEGIQNGIKFEVGKVTDALPEQTALVEFSGSYASSPRFIADIQTTNGGVANLRWENKTATDVDLLIDQEESLQNPTSTSKEDIGYLLLSTFDGDCDGLPDEDEVNAYGTNPQLADTDGDGLPDGEEVSFWGGEWDDDNDGDGKINLLDIDSDGNGFRDGSNEPVGDGTPTNTEVSCASLAVRSHTLTVGDGRLWWRKSTDARYCL